MLTVLRYFLVCMLWVMVGSPVAIAATMASESQEIDRLVQKNPRQSASEAQGLLLQSSQQDNKLLELRALRILAGAHSVLGNLFVLGEDIPRGIQLARQLNEPLAWVELVIAQGKEEQVLGQYAKADQHYLEALAVAQRAQLPLGIAMSYAAIVQSAINRGDKKNVVVHATRAYGLFESQGDVHGMAQMLSALGAQSDDVQKTIEYLDRAIDLLSATSYNWEITLLRYQLGIARFQNKDYANAESSFRKAAAAATGLDVPIIAAYAEYYLGRVALASRDPGEALEHWDTAVPSFEKVNDLPALLETHRLRAAALTAMNRKGESSAAQARAQAVSDAMYLQHGNPQDVARRLSSLSPSGTFRSTYRDDSGVPGQDVAPDVSAGASATIAEAQFEAKLREAENSLLKEQQKGAHLERVSLGLALFGSIGILLIAIFVLTRQVKQKQRFANLAMRDELTGLRNRRSVLEFFRVQLRTRVDLDTCLFVAILDLDHFKKINDLYGHDIGDAVLVAFASACQRQLRSNHALGRFGGEEFLLVMPDTREDQVFEVFERLREVVSEIEIPGMPESHRLSFSMGAAEATSGTVTAEALIKEADLALYRAKKKGRDRCEVQQGRLQAIYDKSLVKSRGMFVLPTATDEDGGGNALPALGLTDSQQVRQFRS